MTRLPVSPQSQAVVDHLLKFAEAHPSVVVELQPFASGGPCEVVVEFLPERKDACDLSLLITEGRTVARFGSRERLSAVHGGAVPFGDPKGGAFELDMRADYRSLNVLLETISGGRLRPFSAVWWGRRLEPLGAYLDLGEKTVYVGETSGFLRGLLELPRLVAFRNAAFAPWE